MKMILFGILADNGFCYRAKARWFKKVLRESRGLDVAADIIERVFGVITEVRAPRVQALDPGEIEFGDFPFQLVASDR